MSTAQANKKAWGKSLRTCYTPWEPERQWKEEVITLSNKVISFQQSDYFDDFFKRQMALFIFDTNRLEGTIPENHREGATMKLILGFLNSTSKEPANFPWHAEGGREADSTDRQLFQFAKAVEYLLKQNISSELSIDLIIETHKIMMSNSYNIDGRNRIHVTVGRVRKKDEEVYAGPYQFLPGEYVEDTVKRLIEEYKGLNLHPISKATYLIYELITIHPFMNGNGRLCRLFLAWSLMRDGFPFPVSFSSGHKKSRQHYIHAINRARRVHEPNRGELNDILIVSMSHVLGNYFENIRLKNGVVIQDNNEE